MLCGFVWVCGVCAGLWGSVRVCAGFLWGLWGFVRVLCGLCWVCVWVCAGFCGVYAGLCGFARRLRADGVEGVSERTAVPSLPSSGILFQGNSTVIGEPDLAAQAAAAMATPVSLRAPAPPPASRARSLVACAAAAGLMAELSSLQTVHNDERRCSSEKRQWREVQWHQSEKKKTQKGKLLMEDACLAV